MKIQAVYEYKFRREANISQTTRNITEVPVIYVVTGRIVRRWPKNLWSGDTTY